MDREKFLKKIKKEKIIHTLSYPLAVIVLLFVFPYILKFPLPKDFLTWFLIVSFGIILFTYRKLSIIEKYLKENVNDIEPLAFKPKLRKGDKEIKEYLTPEGYKAYMRNYSYMVRYIWICLLPLAIIIFFKLFKNS